MLKSLYLCGKTFSEAVWDLLERMRKFLIVLLFSLQCENK